MGEIKEKDISLEVIKAEDAQDSVPTSEVAVDQNFDHKDGRSWYIVQCYAGQEYKVQQRVTQLMDCDEYKQKIFKVIGPEEETIEIKNNKRIERKSKIYPGYVFIQAVLEDSVFYDIRGLPGVAKFIGTRTEAVPVADEEILKVLRKMGDKTKKIDVDFEDGEIIKVISGPFRGYSGPITEINAERGTLKALISIFGRETPVKLDFVHVEKAVK